MKHVLSETKYFPAEQNPLYIDVNKLITKRKAELTFFKKVYEERRVSDLTCPVQQFSRNEIENPTILLYLS